MSLAVLATISTAVIPTLMTKAAVAAVTVTVLELVFEAAREESETSPTSRGPDRKTPLVLG